MKIALLHDHFAETKETGRIFTALCELYPAAEVYSSRHALGKASIGDYNLLLSASGGFAYCSDANPDASHISYCQTIDQFASRPPKAIASSLQNRLSSLVMRRASKDRSRDKAGASDISPHIVASSFHVARQIRKLYEREAGAVIYPPVDTARFSVASPEEIGDHFLIVSRLQSERIGVAIEACSRLGYSLRIVGAGPEMKALRKFAGPDVTFLDDLSDEQIAQEYACCQALIMPDEEDFGAAAVEAMAAGRPVIAFGAGGALETVIDGGTGVFFSEQTAGSLMGAIRSALQSEFSPQVLRTHAMQFDAAVFQRKMAGFVQAVMQHEGGAASANIKPAPQPPLLGADVLS